MRTKEWLRKRLDEKGITQKELADEIGISLNAISKIVRGERFGSAETWDKIEDYLDDDIISVSYDSENLIQELKEDIEEFGKDHQCILVYKIVNDHILFTNYDFIVDEMPFDPKKELEKDEKYIVTTFEYALEVFESQNKIS